MSSVDLNIRFNRPQFDAFNALEDGRTVFLGWGRGCGKSYWLRVLCWLMVAKWDGKLCSPAQPFKGVRIGWLMPSRKQFVDVHSSSIVDELENGGPFAFLGAKINKTTWHIKFPGGSELIPFPATDFNSKAARGYRAHMVVVDECDDISAESYNSIAVPWMSAHWSFRQEVLAGTPTRGRYGLWYRMLEDGRIGQKLRDGVAPEELDIDPDTAEAFKTIYSFHATYRDVPETVSLAAVAKAKATTPKATFEREWEANPDAGEGLVYPFDEDFHVREPDPNTVWSEMLIVADHGWEDPGALALIGVQGSGRDAVCHVLEEVYEHHQGESWWVQRAAKWFSAYPNHKFYADPSMPARVDAYKRAGARVQKVDNSIEDGIAAVANKLIIHSEDVGEDETREFSRLYVSPGCRNTIREFGLYRRKKRADGSFQETPEDRFNHLLDAIRYGIFNRFGPVGPSRRNFSRYDQR